jgi:hypothetical protein
MMETGIEEGTFAFPKPAPFTCLVFRQKRRLCKSVVSPKEACTQVYLPSFPRNAVIVSLWRFNK